MSAETSAALTRPGRTPAVTGIFGHRYLLSLLVRKEVQIRYRGSVLGWLWSYVKPLVQFAVFFLAIGVFLGMNGRVEFFPVYLLAGTTIVTFFSETFTNGTRSFIDNSALIKKIYLPREMFPVASMLVAAVNVAPQIAVIIVIALFFGWVPSFLGVGAILLALVIVALLATGLGLLFGSVNVTFRDAQSFVEIITMCAVWASPVMYQWEMVRESLPAWLFDIYRLNPLTAAVELFHLGIWSPLTATQDNVMPGLLEFSLLALGTSTLVLVIGFAVFRRLEGRFAQDL